MMQDGHGIGKDEVAGSNPAISSRGLAEMQVLFLCLGRFLQFSALKHANHLTSFDFRQ